MFRPPHNPYGIYRFRLEIYRLVHYDSNIPNGDLFYLHIGSFILKIIVKVRSLIRKIEVAVIITGMVRIELRRNIPGIYGL